VSLPNHRSLPADLSRRSPTINHVGDEDGRRGLTLYAPNKLKQIFLFIVFLFTVFNYEWFDVAHHPELVEGLSTKNSEPKMLSPDFTAEL
jgi:hypothetical protein